MSWIDDLAVDISKEKQSVNASDWLNSLAQTPPVQETKLSDAVDKLRGVSEKFGAVPTLEAAGQLAGGAAVWAPSWLARLAYTPYKELTDPTATKEEIREGAKAVQESFSHLIPPPKTEGGKAITEAVGKGFEKALGWATKINEYVSGDSYKKKYPLIDLEKVGHPFLADVTQFLAEIAAFKGVHSVGKKANGALNRLVNKARKGKEINIGDEFENIFKDQKDVKGQEIPPPTPEELATPQARQNYINRWFNTEKERQTTIEDVMGEDIVQTIPNTRETREQIRQVKAQQEVVEPPASRETISGEKSTAQTNTEASEHIQQLQSLMKDIKPTNSVSAMDNLNKARAEVGLPPYEIPKEKETSVKVLEEKPVEEKKFNWGKDVDDLMAETDKVKSETAANIEVLTKMKEEGAFNSKTPIDLDRLPDWVEDSLEGFYYDDKAPKRMKEIARQLLETGEIDKPGLAKTFRNWYNKRAQQKRAEEVEPSVDPDRGRSPGGWDVPDKPIIESDYHLKQEVLQRSGPIKSSNGKVVTNKVMAEALAEKQGIKGKLVKDPETGGWRVRKSKADVKKFEEELRKDYERQLAEEGLEEIEPGSTQKALDIYDLINNESGNINIDFKLLANKFKYKFKDSKIRDSSGKPLVLYHGTGPGSFDTFSSSKIGSSTDYGFYGRGFYFTADPKMASNYAIHREGSVRPVYLNLKNPLTDSKLLEDIQIATWKKDVTPEEGAILIRDQIKELGYDGVIIKEANEYVAFDSNQIIPVFDSLKVSPLNILKNQRGEITISKEQVEKLRTLFANGTYKAKDLAKGLRAKGVSEKTIEDIFKKASFQSVKKGKPKESKWLQKGDDPNELLPRRKKRGKDQYAPAVSRGEAHTVSTAKDIKGRIWNENWSMETADKTFQRITDVNGSGIADTFFWPMKEADTAFVKEFKQKQKLSKDLRKTISGKSQKRVGIYALAKQEGGEVILEQMGYPNVPKLTPAEMKVYETLREEFRTYYDRVNEAREAAGETRFPAVDNYFTWLNDMKWLQDEHGIGMMDNWQTMESKLHNRKTVGDFRFAKHRGGEDRPRKLELNPFTIYETYSKSALETIHKAPVLAKQYELLLDRYGLKDNAPNIYNFLTEWREHQTGKPHILSIIKPKTFKILRAINNNVAISILAGNLRSALIQPSALAGTFTELGRYTGIGMAKALEPKEWERAYNASNTLLTRTPEVSVFETMEGSGKLLKGQRKVADVALSPLSILDKYSAMVTWLGAEAKAKALKMENPSKYADMIVDRTQASASKTNRSPIQRHIMGQTFTGLQTFVINHWGWLTREVLGINNAQMSNPEAFGKIMRYVIATTAINALYEDVVGINSPFATPIRSFQETKEQTDNNIAATVSAAKELLEYIPVVGGTIKYGSQFGGPLVDTLWDIKDTGEDAIGAYGSEEFDDALQKHVTAVSKLSGVPGINQFSKSFRAYQRDGNAVDIILGRYVETEGGRRRSSRGSRRSSRGR